MLSTSENSTLSLELLQNTSLLLKDLHLLEWMAPHPVQSALCLSPNIVSVPMYAWMRGTFCHQLLLRNPIDFNITLVACGQRCWWFFNGFTVTWVFSTSPKYSELYFFNKHMHRDWLKYTSVLTSNELSVIFYFSKWFKDLITHLLSMEKHSPVRSSDKHTAVLTSHLEKPKICVHLFYSHYHWV